MRGLGYAGALVLAGVFAVAGAVKARHPALTEQHFSGLGLPMPRALARAVPGAELVIAVLLVVVPVAGGLTALAALAFFTTAIASRLRAGVRAPCGCFGSSTDEPLSRATVIRNLLLAVPAVGAVATPAPVAPSAGAVAAALGAAAVGLAVLALVRPSSASSPSEVE